MLFKYKLKNKWYSVDIPKEEYDTFLDLTFADKLKYIKLLKQQEQAEAKASEVSQDLGFSVLGTKKAPPAPNQTIEQLQDKEAKKILAKKKMAELTKKEEEISNTVKEIEKKPEAEPDVSLLDKLEKLLEQREILVHEIQTLNVENVAVMNVKSVDTLNIKGINKLVSDMNSSNITETFNKVKEELNKVYSSLGDQNLKRELERMTKDFYNTLKDVLNTNFNKSESLLYTVLEKLSKLTGFYNFGHIDIFRQIGKKGTSAPFYDNEDNVLCVFNTFNETNNSNLQTQMALCLNLLLDYNPTSGSTTSVIKVIRWTNKEGYLDEVKNLTDTVYIIPTEENNGQLEESLKVMAKKIYKYFGSNKGRDKAIEKLKDFSKMMKNIMNVDIFKSNGEYKEGQSENMVDNTYNTLIGILERVKSFTDGLITDLESEKPVKKIDEATSGDDSDYDGLGTGFLADMMLKKLEEKLKKTSESLAKIENKINELKGKQNVKDEPQKIEDKPIKQENGFVIPKLNHVEPVIKPQFNDEYKDIKDILERRRKDIEYSEEEDDISDEWEDNQPGWDNSYTELTAGSLSDATELIDSLRDNYNIVLRMYINKKLKK